MLHAHVRRGQSRSSPTCSRFVTAAGGPNLPLTGAFNARIKADGPLHALTASGSAQMEQGSLYGEPVSGLRVQAALAGQVLKLTSATIQ